MNITAPCYIVWPTADGAARIPETLTQLSSLLPTGAPPGVDNILEVISVSGFLGRGLFGGPFVLIFLIILLFGFIGGVDG